MGCSGTKRPKIKFNIVKEIGKKKNLFCHSFLIRSEKTNMEYAYKRVNIKASDPEKKKILNYIKVLKKINHPNIILLKKAYYSSNKNYLNIITEYADDGDLQTKIDELKEKNEKEGTKEYFDGDTIINWFVQICIALKYIHNNKILHRDIKPSNIYLMKNNKDNFAKLGDFDVAKILSPTLKYAKTKVTTPQYLAPEIINNEVYDSKADIWSLGVTFYQLITLSLPFEGNSEEEIQENIVKGNKKEIPKDYKIDPQFIVLINQMLSLKPDERPSAEDILKNTSVKSRTDCFLSINNFSLKASALEINKYENSDDNEFNKNIFFIINGVDKDEDDKMSIVEDEKNPIGENDQKQIDEEENKDINENRIKKVIYDFHRQMTLMCEIVIKKTNTL